MQVLESDGHQVTGQSLVDFQAVTFHECPQVDWVFFSSPRAVHFFLEGLKNDATTLPEDVRLAALGEGTARALEEEGQEVSFTGNGDPVVTAGQFLTVAEGLRVLFPRARISKRSVQETLKGHLQVFEVVVYDNVPSGDVPAEDFDILVFTSPLNAQAFFAVKGQQAGQRVVAIGKTTAWALAALGIEGVAVAARPSEEELASSVLRLLGA